MWFLLKYRYNIKPTEKTSKVIIDAALGRTGSEMVVGIGVKVSQYFTVAHVKSRAFRLSMRVTHRISLDTLVGPLNAKHK